MTTSDTVLEQNYPTVTQLQVPQKIIHGMTRLTPIVKSDYLMLILKEPLKLLFHPLLLQQQYQLLKEGLELEKVAWCQFKFSQNLNCHADLFKGEADAPSPLKKKTVSSTASTERGEEPVCAPCK